MLTAKDREMINRVRKCTDGVIASAEETESRMLREMRKELRARKNAEEIEDRIAEEAIIELKRQDKNNEANKEERRIL